MATQGLHSSHTVARQKLQNGYTETSQGLHRICTGATQKLHRGYTESEQELHRNFTGATQNLHRSYTETAQELHRDCTEATQRLHRGYTETACGQHRSHKAHTVTWKKLSNMLTSHHSLKYKPKKSLKFRHQLHEHEFYTSCWNLNTRHSIGDYSISVWNISSVYIYTLRGQTAQPIHWETSHVETNLQDQTHSSNQPLFTIYNDTKIQESAF